MLIASDWRPKHYQALDEFLLEVGDIAIVVVDEVAAVTFPSALLVSLASFSSE